MEGAALPGNFPPLTPVTPPPPPDLALHPTLGYAVSSPLFYVSLLYLGVALYSALQFGRILFHGHKKKSFASAFFVLLTVWGLLRFVFFMFQSWVGRIDWLATALYQAPVVLQFTTFSLLVVYYKHLELHFKSQWRSFKRQYLWACGIFNLLLLLMEFAWWLFGVLAKSHSTEVPAWLAVAQQMFSGVVFLVLVIVLAFRGYWAARVMRETEFADQTKQVARLSWAKILGVTVALFLLFTSRFCYDVVAALDQGARMDFNAFDQSAVGWVVFGFFLAWEVLPAALVLFLFGWVAATAVRKKKRTDYGASVNADAAGGGSAGGGGGGIDGGYDSHRDRHTDYFSSTGGDGLGGLDGSASEAERRGLMDERHGGRAGGFDDDGGERFPPTTYQRPAGDDQRAQPTDSLLRASLFNDPTRYDSDSDVSPFQPGSGPGLGYSPAFGSGQGVGSVGVPSPYSLTQWGQ